MLAILAVTFPFFALIGIGYLAARSGILPVEAVPGLNVFTLYFALTAMLFQLGARTPVVELFDPVVLGLWFLAALAVMAIGVATARGRGKPWVDASFGGLIATLPNSGFMGVPLLIVLVGPQAAGPISASLIIDIVFMQSIAVALSQRGSGTHASAGSSMKASAVRVAKNPLPWAILLGGLWGTLGVTLPGPVDALITMLAAAATPAALFTIGAVLARAQGTAPPGRVRTGIRAWGDVYWLAALKLFAHPALTWVFGRALIALGLPLSEAALTVLVLTAALPAAANVSVLAERFGADNGRIARVILVSTVLSFATFTAAVAIIL